MRILGLALLALIFLLPSGASADGTLKCGIKPIPDIGCKIGRCVPEFISRKKAVFLAEV